MSVRTHVDSGAGIITMTDGSGGNRLNAVLIEDLKKAVDRFREDPEIRFILLRSSGLRFCHGMDLGAYSGGNNTDELIDGIQAYADLLQALHHCPKTTVALVEGSVKAGGVGLAAACDVVVAAETADFELSELYLGLIPANVMPYVLSTRMPAKRAAYLVQTAALADAETARCWGLVDEVHPPEAIEGALKKLGRRLMRLSPAATAQYKKFAADLMDLPPSRRGKKAVETFAAMAPDPGLMDVARKFADGELPPWFGGFRPEMPLSGVSGERL